MIIVYRYRLLPTKRQHRALEQILESQRQLHNAALEERIDAYRKAGVARTYIDQTEALTEWRRSEAAKAGVLLIEVDPRNTSQECSGCGTKVLKDLSDRHHDCPHCGLSIDRDINAARNILNRAGVGPGLRNVAGCGMRAGKNLDSAPRSRQESVASS